MTAKKVTVSFPSELVLEIRTNAARDGESFSAWLTEAAARRIRDQRLDEFNKAMEAEFGPVDPARVEELRRAWFRSRPEWLVNHSMTTVCWSYGSH